MKKLTSVLALALCTVSVFAFTACGQKTTQEKQSEVKSEVKEVQSESLEAKNEVESKSEEVKAESQSVENEAAAESVLEETSK